MELNRLTNHILTLLVWDDDSAKFIRNVLQPEWLESSIHRKLVTAAYTYLDTYHTAPKAHDIDLLTELGDKEAQLGKIILDDLKANHEAGVNVKYVRDNLEQFIRHKQLSTAGTEFLEYLTAGQLDEAETTITKVLKQRFSLFEPGLYLKDFGLTDLLTPPEDMVMLGIPALDEVEQVPTRGAVYLIIGGAKKGKSWSLIHIARQAALQRKRVLYITLELSERQVVTRLGMSVAAATKRPQDAFKLVSIQTDELGRFLALDLQQLEKPRPSLQNDKDFITNLIKSTRLGERILVKQFPNKRLTMNGLIAYLDSLETSANFIPDVLIVDQADNLKIAGQQPLRIELGEIYQELRGLAVERNMAVATVTQSNREGVKAGSTKDTHVAEDYSKIGTVDTVLTYSQTQSEKDLGVARLFLANGRNDADKFEILITQHYAMGQFVLDSVRVPADYQARLKESIPLLEELQT